MDDGIDTGDIIERLGTCRSGRTTTVRDLYFNNLAAAKALFLEERRPVGRRRLPGPPSPLAGASYYSRHSIEYGALHLDLKKTAFEIHNQFRAFTFREFQVPTYRRWGVCRTASPDQRSTLRAGRLVEETDAHFRSPPSTTTCC